MTKAATKQVEEFTAGTKKAMEEGVEKMSKGFEDASQFGQDNVEAMVASSKVMAKAAEEMNAEMIAFSKKSYEDGMAAMKELGSVKSVSDFFEMQTSLAKTSFEGFVAEATKLNEMYAAAAKDAVSAEYVFFDRATIPAGAYRGLDEAYEGLDVGSMHLITSADADEETIYRVLRSIWENREKVVAKHAAGRAIQPSVVVRDTGTPFHPGAVRSYREIGIWPEESAAADSAPAE